ncbi:hypothetical protein Tco_0973418 [Tanacetum coccineum]
MKLLQFLMSLNNVFQPIRGSLLSRETLPDVKVFGFVSKSNNWTNNRNKKVDNKKYGNTVNIGNNRGPNPNLFCKNITKLGHTIDRCFDLIVYPPGCNKNPGPKQKGFKSFKANSASTSNENGTSLSFTNEQMLMNLINEVPSGNM